MICMTKKILFVVNVDWFFISHRLPIAVEAIKNGYEVHLACDTTRNNHDLIELGVIIHEVKFSRSGSGLFSELSTLFFLRSIIKFIRPDIIHAITIKPVIYSGLIVRTLTSKPSFVAAISGLGYVFSAKSPRVKATRILVSLLYRIALNHEHKLVIFQNQSDNAILSAVANIHSTQKILIRGSGVDLNRYSYKSEPEGSIVKVVMASRLLKEKGVYEFVAAARLLLKKGLPVQFILVGSSDPDNPNSVSKVEIQSWHESGLITALGHRDDVHNIFSNSHIVTLPSYYGEGVPKVLIEAAACGRAIVTTTNPGCCDAVIPDETGLLVPAQDPQALADAIELLASNKNMRVSMGKSGRLFAENEFDVKSVVSKHLEIYDRILRP
jgi:glycosyltransferase involved in cell wall biosynthesis